MPSPSVLITGSTRGVGLAIARTLAAVPGVNVMLHSSGLGPGGGRSLQRDIDAALVAVRDVAASKGDGRVLHATADLRHANECAGLISEAAAAFGRIDVLVNNAAAAYPDEFAAEAVPDELWADVLALNLSAPFHLIKAALPGMKRRKFGRIINVGCAAGIVSAPNNVPFTAEKHGLQGLTKTVALELATCDGSLTCNMVAPGLVDGSGLLRVKAERRAAAVGETFDTAATAVVDEVCPTGRAVAGDEVGAAVAYLAMPATRSVNGTTIVVDGGWTAQN